MLVRFLAQLHENLKHLGSPAGPDTSLADRWQGKGHGGERFLKEQSLYAADMDLFGEGSLFQLLSIARTGAGEETLAAWLKTRADADTIAARQQVHRQIGLVRRRDKPRTPRPRRLRHGAGTICAAHWNHGVVEERRSGRRLRAAPPGPAAGPSPDRSDSPRG